MLEATAGDGTEETPSKTNTETQSKNHELSVLNVILSPWHVCNISHFPFEKKKNKQKKAADESVEYSLRDSLFTACKVGDVDALETLLQLPTQTADIHQQSDSRSTTVLGSLSLLNEPVDSSGFTLLHVASAAAQKATVRLLMDAGADPACRCENSSIECDTNACVHS